jgi:mannose-6-phosphate isomerase-like protein (cupin superfamily)
MVSPLNTGSRLEIVHIALPSGAKVSYEALYEPHYEQHVLVTSGKLTVKLGDEAVALCAGDCIRSRLDVPHSFANYGRGNCKYLVVIGR